MIRYDDIIIPITSSKEYYLLSRGKRERGKDYRTVIVPFFVQLFPLEKEKFVRMKGTDFR